MPLDIRIRFGRAIRRLREEQGITRKKLRNDVNFTARTTAALSLS
jgi:hypothetical protein